VLTALAARGLRITQCTSTNMGVLGGQVWAPLPGVVLKSRTQARMWTGTCCTALQHTMYAPGPPDLQELLHRAGSHEWTKNRAVGGHSSAWLVAREQRTASSTRTQWRRQNSVHGLCGCLPACAAARRGRGVCSSATCLWRLGGA
jgi:hypothetical protein